MSSNNIPVEIYFEIFLKLRVKSILACKYVCKTWFSLISSPDFVKMQLNLARNKPNLMLNGYASSVFYSIDHDSLELLLSKDRFLEYAVEIDCPFKSSGCSTVTRVGYCDGLVCLWFSVKRVFCLWNPATREYKVLPKSNNIHPKSSTYSVAMVAFGYDYKSDDYKLLVGFHDCLFEVCWLRSNSWKTIESVPYEFHTNKPSGVHVNGNLHWLAKKKVSSHVVLASLDISNEIFKEVALPKEPLESVHVSFRNLVVLEGYLCLLVGNNLCDSVEVWVMQNYGVRESWTKRCIVKDGTTVRNCMSLMWSFKSGEILFSAGYAGLYVYSPENGMLAIPNIPSLSYSNKDGCYSETLVSLSSENYVGGEQPLKD